MHRITRCPLPLTLFAAILLPALAAAKAVPAGGSCSGSEFLLTVGYGEGCAGKIDASIGGGNPGATLTLRVNGDPATDTAVLLDGSGSADVTLLDFPAGFHSVEIVECGKSDSAAIPTLLCEPRREDPPTAPGVPGEADGDPKRDAEPGTAGDGILACTGELRLESVDLRILGRGLDFLWMRKYRSKIGPDTTIGNGWSHGYDIRVEQAGQDLFLHDGQGRADLFVNEGGSNYGSDELFVQGIQNPDQSFSFVFADGGTWELHALDGSAQEGRVSSIVDRNGNTIDFDYDGLGRLVAVHDPLDRPANPRVVSIAYNASGFIESITDWTGRQVQYEYYQNGDPDGSFGDLKSVTSPSVTGTPNGNDFPNGKTTLYTYSTGFADDELNHNLLSITDPMGQTYLTNTYAATQNPADLDYDRIARQVWGDPGDNIDLVYVPESPTPANGFALQRTIVNDRVGNVRECWFDGFNRLVREDRFTGRADPDQPTTAVSNRPTGQLRPGDPALFTTRHIYNADARIVQTIHPNGNQTQFVHELDLTPAAPRRSRGNLRELQRLPGPLGGDQTLISESFEYDPVNNFVDRHVDGRGNETLHVYDAQGNCTQTTGRIPSIVTDRQYNAFGQLAQVTHPDNSDGSRRIDAFTYYQPADGAQFGYRKEAIVNQGGFALTTAFEYDSLGRLTRKVDPRGNDTLFFRNELDQVVREFSREIDDGSAVRILGDIYWNGNDQPVRTDVQNIDDERAIVSANPHLTVMRDRGTLNEVIRICTEVGTFDVPQSPPQLDCAGLPTSEFITLEIVYDANRNPTLLLDGEATNGNQPTNVVRTLWDERDLVLRKIRAEGDPDQSTTQTDHDPNGNPTSEQEGLEDTPRTTVTTYDGFDRPTRIQDPMGNEEELGYDANGNLVHLRRLGELVDTDPGGAANVRLGEEDRFYDPMDRLTRREVHFFAKNQAPLPGGQVSGKAVTTTGYSDNSQVTLVEDDNLHATITRYDTMNRIREEADPKGNVTRYDYDANSNVVMETSIEKDDLGGPDETYVRARTYDKLDRVTSKSDNLGNTISTGYDSRNNRTVLRDALRSSPIAPGNVTRFDYDGANRLVTTTRTLTDDGTGAGSATGSIVTRQEWDHSSRLRQKTDDAGHRTRYTYDALDRLVVTGMADGTLTQVGTGASWSLGDDDPDLSGFTSGYDAHDNQVTTTDANGTVVIGVYDRLERLSGRTVSPGTGVSGDTTQESYEYDGRSRPVRGEDDDSVVTRCYDSKSNVTEEDLGGQTTASTYDGEGNRLTCTYPMGRTITNTFDELDRKATVSDGGGLIGRYDYIGRRVARLEYGNGTRTSFEYDGIANDPGDFGVKRVVGMAHTRIGDGTVLDQRTYAWDAMYRKLRRSDVRPGGPGLTHGYRYDSAHRLDQTSVTDPGLAPVDQRGYELDGVGNRVRTSGGQRPGSYTRRADLSEPADMQVNQYTSTPFDERAYDANGNLIFVRARPLSFPSASPGIFRLGGGGGSGAVQGATLFGGAMAAPGGPRALTIVEEHSEVWTRRALALSYDYADRLVEVVDLSSGARHTYAYDAFGRRTARIVDADGAALQTRYFYGDWQVLEEQDGLGATLATYVYGNRMDEVLSMSRAGSDLYYHTDDLGSVVALSDAAGVVVERYEYGDFGEPAFFDGAGVSTSQSAASNPYLFTGRRHDAETGWYHYRFRYLDPHSGRFITRDPIGTWADEANLGNAYCYVGNDPASHTDPLGLMSYDPNQELSDPRPWSSQFLEAFERQKKKRRWAEERRREQEQRRRKAEEWRREQEQAQRERDMWERIFAEAERRMEELYGPDDFEFPEN